MSDDVVEPISDNYEETTRARLAELNVRLKDETLPEEGSRRPRRIRFSQELVRVAPSPPPLEVENADSAGDDESQTEEEEESQKVDRHLDEIPEQEPEESIEDATYGNNPAVSDMDSSSSSAAQSGAINGGKAGAKNGANSGADNGAKSSAIGDNKSPQTAARPAANREQQPRRRPRISHDQWCEEKRRQAQLESERARRQREWEERNRRQAQDELTASRPTLEEWLAGKKTQCLHNELLKMAEEDDILRSREVHTPQQCHRAYRLWLRRKGDQNRREAEELRDRLRSAEQVMRRNRLSRNLLSSASASSAGFYRYLDYYGYR